MVITLPKQLATVIAEPAKHSRRQPGELAAGGILARYSPSAPTDAEHEAWMRKLFEAASDCGVSLSNECLAAKGWHDWMAILADTSLLARLANTADPMFQVAETATDELHKRGEVLHITALKLLVEFRNMATRPKASKAWVCQLRTRNKSRRSSRATFPLLAETPDIYPARKALGASAGSYRQTSPRRPTRCRLSRAFRYALARVQRRALHAIRGIWAGDCRC